MTSTEAEVHSNGFEEEEGRYQIQQGGAAPAAPAVVALLRRPPVQCGADEVVVRGADGIPPVDERGALENSSGGGPAAARRGRPAAACEEQQPGAEGRRLPHEGTHHPHRKKGGGAEDGGERGGTWGFCNGLPQVRSRRELPKKQMMLRKDANL